MSPGARTRRARFAIVVALACICATGATLVGQTTINFVESIRLTDA